MKRLIASVVWLTVTAMVGKSVDSPRPPGEASLFNIFCICIVKLCMGNWRYFCCIACTDVTDWSWDAAMIDLFVSTSWVGTPVLDARCYGCAHWRQLEALRDPNGLTLVDVPSTRHPRIRLKSRRLVMFKSSWSNSQTWRCDVWRSFLTVDHDALVPVARLSVLYVCYGLYVYRTV
jgi:hypothetical protein